MYSFLTFYIKFLFFHVYARIGVTYFKWSCICDGGMSKTLCQEAILSYLSDGTEFIGRVGVLSNFFYDFRKKKKRRFLSFFQIYCRIPTSFTACESHLSIKFPSGDRKLQEEISLSGGRNYES